MRAFLNKKFLEWQASFDERQTVTKFAHWLGVNRGTLYQWMNGDRVPEADSLQLLSEKLGPEVYDAAGVARPDPVLDYLAENWGKIDEQTRKEIQAMAARALTRRSGVPDSGEGVEVHDAAGESDLR